MNTHPWKLFTYFINYSSCDDTSSNNIVYFDKYVLYRPNYQRKLDDGYIYHNAILIDLENSYIDIDKFYHLLHENNIHIKDVKHILLSIWEGSNEDKIWLSLLEKAIHMKYMVIPYTFDYNLKRVLFNKEEQSLIITSNDFEDHYITYIDLETFTIEDTDGDVTDEIDYTNTKGIFCCEFSYTGWYNNEIVTIDKFNYDKVYSGSHCSHIELCIGSYTTKYTHVITGNLKAKGLLFVEKGANEFEWHVNNFNIVDCLNTLSTGKETINPDMMPVIHSYMLTNAISYYKKTYHLWTKLYCSSIYYLISEKYENTKNQFMTDINPGGLMIKFRSMLC